MPLVAVYGTLKKGYENYERYLAPLEPSFRGPVRLPFRLFDNGDYPMLLPDVEEHTIHVEVFEVDEPTLARLDALEEPYGYRRRSVVLAELGREVEIYYFPASPPAGFRPVPSGEWTKRRD